MAGTRLVISDEEKDFIVSCVQQDFRVDGRACGEYRTVHVRRGVVSNTHGSSLVSLSKTQVLVGVKAELQETEFDFGRIEASIDFGGEALSGDSRDDDLVLQLTNNLQRMIDSSQIDLQQLSVVPGKFCWVIYVDSVILQCEGNLLDALGIGVKAALEDTELPNLIITREGDKVDIEVSDDPYDTKCLDTTNVPVIVTLSRIGERFVVDSCPEEEACSTAKLVLMVNSSGLVCGIQKYGQTGIDPEYLFEMIEFGKSSGKTLLTLTEALNKKQ